MTIYGRRRDPKQIRHWRGARSRARRGRSPWNLTIQAEPLEDRTLLSTFRPAGGESAAGRVAADVAAAAAIYPKPELLRDAVAPSREVSTTEVLVAVRTGAFAGRGGELRAVSSAQASRWVDAATARPVLTTDEVTIYEVGLRRGADPMATVAKLRGLDQVAWASPNYIYRDAREFVPDDPLFDAQYHHPLMDSELAWDFTLGSPGVTIAVTDDGFDLEHQDLAANIWVNPGEVAGNGVDDDGNGFVDDVNGWDFSNNDNNPRPDSAFDDHGTHVAGIAAARTNNGVGVAGTAGGASIMPIRFYDGFTFTSAIIAASFQYAADNGAQIINTSYNIEGFVGDPTLEAAFDYIYDAGVLHFTSAGNDNQANPGRQAFTQTLFVASTDAADLKSDFSNYGTGIDISAPGSDILSTLLGNTYGYYSGTSMASPNAAGVAALVWSANPWMDRDQVAAVLLGTADDLDALNPAFAGLLGTGRVNPYRAITEALPAPRFGTVAVLPEDGGMVGAIDDFKIDLAYVLEPDTVNDLANFELRSAGPDGSFDTEDDVLIPLTLGGGRPHRVGTNRLEFAFDDLADGLYRFTARSGGLTDPFGQPLDGDGDGAGGDDFVRTFGVDGTLGPFSNDDFEDARVIPAGLPYTDSSTNVDATGEAGEPNHAGVSNPLNSVWWTWTATTGGLVTFDTIGSSFDTTLAVYTGDSVDALTLVASNDDAFFTQSRVSFLVTPGTTYRIAVDGYSGDSGDVVLNAGIVLVPNDDFADATPLFGASATTLGTNVDATGEPGEPDHAGGSEPLNSAWWAWTAPRSGSVTIDTFGSDFDTALAIYTGSSVDDLTTVASNDDSGGLQSSVTFDAVAGTIYRIAVDGIGDATGDIALSLMMAPPLNDDFANATPLTDSTFNVVLDNNEGATGEEGEPIHGGEAPPPINSIWFSWTAPADGVAYVDTFGSNFDTSLGVYTGTSVDDLTLIAQNEDISFPFFLESAVSFDVTAGTTYFFAVDGWEASVGDVVLNHFFAEPPENDDFADAIALADPFANTVFGYTYASTGEEGEPIHGGEAPPPINSIWFSWTAPADGVVLLDTFGSNFDTSLGVYTGSSVDDLTLIAENEDAAFPFIFEAALSFEALAGTTYFFAVDGWGASVGDVVLNHFFAEPPENDDFADAIALADPFANTVFGYTYASTGEEGEPIHGGEAPPPINSIWFSWTAPADGVAYVDTFGSNFDTSLGVYTGTSVDDLTLIAQNEDAEFPFIFEAALSFEALAGTTYFFAVDGWEASVGDVVLNHIFTVPPANDDFADAIALADPYSNSVTGSNLGASGEDGEPDHAGTSAPLSSVWWTWTATADGPVTIDTFGSNFDTTLAVYTGDAVDDLTLVASNDDFGSLQSLVSFEAVAGTTYRIAVDGYSFGTGDVVLTLDAAPVALSSVIDDGSGQRSMVRTVLLSFSEAVTFAPGAVVLTSSTGGVLPVTATVEAVPGSPGEYLVTFSGDGIVGGSLQDGRYTLTVVGDLVADAAGQALGDDLTIDFHRFFGDGDGDADVDAADFRQIRTALLGPAGVDWFDYDADGDTDNDDYNAFRIRQRKGRL